MQSLRGAPKDESLLLIAKVKTELASRISAITKFKSQVLSGSNGAISTQSLATDAHQKSKQRVVIENLLIEVNEEIFRISDELSKAYSNS